MSNNSVRSTEVAVDDVFVEHTDLVIGKDSRGCELSHYILAERIVLDEGTLPYEPIAEDPIHKL
jgi:hypothetical protein